MTSDPAYFLYHSIGQYPGKAQDMAAALSGFSENWAATNDAQWPNALAARAEFLNLWRALIEAPEGSLTSAENVTTALFSVLGGLPKGRLQGRKVLITADCFPSLHFLLNGLQERLDFTLHTVALRPGEFWVREDDILEAWDETVGLALLTFVTSTASYRCDLAGLIAHGHRMGSLVGVDLTQGIGIIPFSLNDFPADFALSTTLKWLCGTPGAGVIQMHPELIAETQPDLRGWFSQDNPFSWDLDAFDYAPDARRFDHGTPSLLACLGSTPALKWHAKQHGLLAHNRALSEKVIEEAEALGLTLASPLDPGKRGGSVMLQLPAKADPYKIVDALRDQEIFVDARGQILRVSPGAITTTDHVTALFEALRPSVKN